jgi:hypothetical protein
MLRRVALVRTDVSEELSASIFRVTRIGELGSTLATASNRNAGSYNNHWRHIPEDSILHSHHHENLTSYVSKMFVWFGKLKSIVACCWPSTNSLTRTQPVTISYFWGSLALCNCPFSVITFPTQHLSSSSMVLRMRLAPSKEPNRWGVSPPSYEDRNDPVSET